MVTVKWLEKNVNVKLNQIRVAHYLTTLTIFDISLYGIRSKSSKAILNLKLCGAANML